MEKIKYRAIECFFEEEEPYLRKKEEEHEDEKESTTKNKRRFIMEKQQNFKEALTQKNTDSNPSWADLVEIEEATAIESPANEVQDDKSLEEQKEENRKTQGPRKCEVFIFIEEDEILEAAEEWKFSLIGTVLGLEVSFGLMWKTVKAIWRIGGKIQVIDVGAGYFI